MTEKKSYMPQSTAGLLRYDESVERGIKIKPEHVVAVSILFAIFVKALSIFSVF